VYFNGSFIPWWTWGTAPLEYQMHDDGQDGDAVAGDRVYSLKVSFKKGAARKLVYKFGIESSDNEAAVGDNHERYINLDGSYTLPLDTFGNMVKEAGQTLGNLTISLQTGAAGTKVVLTWPGSAGIKVQKAAGITTPAWTDVPGTEGASTAEIPAASGVEFYRLIRP
jgi:hypothetical protein